MLDLRELLELLETAEDDLLESQTAVPYGLNKAIATLHTEIHKEG